MKQLNPDDIKRSIKEASARFKETNRRLEAAEAARKANTRPATPKPQPVTINISAPAIPVAPPVPDPAQQPQNTPGTPSAAELQAIEKKKGDLERLLEQRRTLKAEIDPLKARKAKILDQLAKIEKAKGVPETTSTTFPDAELQELREELKNTGMLSPLRKFDLKKEIKALEKEAPEIKKDRKENPFKYFVLDKICLRNKRFLSFLDLTMINKRLGKDGREFQSNRLYADLVRNTNYAMYFSTNGFYMRVINAKDLKIKDGTSTKELQSIPEVRYEVIDPNGVVVPGSSNIDLRQAYDILTKNSKEYQDELIAEFEAQNNP